MTDEKMFTQDEVNQMISERLKQEKNTLDAYKAQIAKEAAAQAEADAIRERFAAALGDGREVVHPRLLDLMVEDFTAAINDPANADKTDGEVFTQLFQDQGYFRPKRSAPSYQLRRAPSNYNSGVRKAFGFKD